MSKKNVSTEMNKENSLQRPPIPGGAVVAAAPPLPAVAKEHVNLEEWGVHEQMLTHRDIQIPKILPMQAMSKLVTDGDAKFGEFRESLNNAVLGDLDHPVEFVPFYMEKVYVVMRLKEGKYRFHRTVPISPANENQEFECTTEGIAEKWYRTLNFYVLLPGEIERGEAIPHVLSFRSSSARAGQKLTTTMYVKNLQAGKSPASSKMRLLGNKTTNDKGTFVVLDVEFVGASTDAEVAECKSWVKKIRGGEVKVDQSDLERDAQATAAPAPSSSEY